MLRRNLMVPAIMVAAAVAACGEDGPAPTGPSPEPRSEVAALAAGYTIRPLGTLGGNQSRASAINNVGETVGWSYTSSGKPHAFLFRAGVMRDLGALAGGHSEALAINDASVVVGFSTILNGDMRAVRWKDGVKKNLGTLGGRNSMARGINKDGTIVGWAETGSGARHAFVWKNGVMRDIGTLGGATSQANGINNVGKVVGSSETASGETHAFAWANSSFQDLGDDGRAFGVAMAISNGRIAGFFGPARDAEGGERESITPWILASGVLTIFPTRQETSQATGINPDGIVVGYDENVRYELATANAWVRRSDGTVGYLPELSDGHAAALGINRYGTIAGFSSTADGWPKAVIWRPQ